MVKLMQVPIIQALKVNKIQTYEKNNIGKYFLKFNSKDKLQERT